MRLVFPTMAYKEKAIEYIQEFWDAGSEVNGSGALDDYVQDSTYEEWLQKVISDMDVANIPAPKVPALTYFYVREKDDRIVGMCNLRLALNDFLRTEGGHIGYSVRPTERCKHYATDMLAEALKVYDRFGISDVLVTCDKENPASAKVIQNNDGVLEAEFYSETYDETLQRYVIRRACNPCNTRTAPACDR